ncbi:MAG: hypothetical protein RL040_665 [Bacteroidota bacterium]|jgi:hypothetical protein
MKNSVVSTALIHIMKPIYILLAFLSPTIVFAQGAVGSWRDHFQYNRFIDVCEAGDMIYGATINTICSYNKSSGEVSRYNKTNQLSDVGISAINYDATSGFVIVGYRNGNIDFFNDNGTINLPYIKFSSLVGDKTIYDIYPYDNRVYLSTGFGVVVLDMSRLEIKETYFLGTSGETVITRDLCIINETIYATTNQGVRVADINNTFLSNFENWTTLTGLPNNAAPTQIEFFNNELVLVVSETTKDAVWSKPLNGDSWTIRHPIDYFRISRLWSNGEWIYVSGNFAYWYCHNNFDNRVYLNNYRGTQLDVSDAIRGSNGESWVADKRSGLIRSIDNTGTQDFRVSPAGPKSDNCRRITAFNNNIWIAHGGVRADWGSNYNIDGISALLDENWIHLISDTTNSAGQHFNSSNQYVMDMMDFAIDPNDNSNVYGGSWEEGILRINASALSMTPTNGTGGVGANSDGITEGFSRIAVGGLTFDENGTLWFTNSYTNEAIHARDRNGVFYDYNFEDVLEEDEVVADIIISKDGYAWANVITKGLLVFNGNNTLGTYSDDNYKFLTDEEGNGKLPSRDVLCMEEDLDGEVWVGTASGLAIFYSPTAIFEQSNINAEQILIQQDGNTQILLETEAINCIEIDGSNRKWIGTKNSGVYLLSDDGLGEVYHFTETNSPLPANNVYDVAINHSTGEVLFATENGIVGFFSTATNFDNEMSDVRVYPNPVRPDFEGNITIDGLAYDSNVKVTDIQGNILYETMSEGGRAIWNGRLIDGTRPATGVYLIYAGSPDGEAAKVRKVTFIR